MKDPQSDPTQVTKTEAQWRAQLSPKAYRVTRERGTELPFANRFCHTRKPGRYSCVCCEALLFDSSAKYDSSTGWPSFTEPAGEVVATREDARDGVVRTEAVCSRCDAHLGHVFRDGPSPGGLRFCINSAALKFEPS